MDEMKWRSLEYESPREWLVIEVKRPEWPEPKIIKVADLHPAFNAALAVWRPIVGRM